MGLMWKGDWRCWRTTGLIWSRMERVHLYCGMRLQWLTDCFFFVSLFIAVWEMFWRSDHPRGRHNRLALAGLAELPFAWLVGVGVPVAWRMVKMFISRKLSSFLRTSDPRLAWFWCACHFWCNVVVALYLLSATAHDVVGDGAVAVFEWIWCWRMSCCCWCYGHWWSSWCVIWAVVYLIMSSNWWWSFLVVWLLW